MADEQSQPGGSGLGRRILLTVGGIGVLIGGLLGFVVGANSSEATAKITVGGVFAVPITPGAMTVYGMVVVAVALIGLFGLLSVASRFDTNAQ